MYFCRLHGEESMDSNRLRGLFIQEFYIMIHSFEIILDIFVSPVMSVIVFAFLGVFLSGSTKSSIAYSLLLGTLLWQIVFITQYSVSVGSLWNIWSRNLSNMFVAPISLTEYLFAQAVSGITKALVIFILTTVAVAWIYHFNIYSIGGLNLIFFFINLVLFALSFGLVMLGLIFRYGTKIQAFSWGILPLLQPVTAVFYPVSVLPAPLQTVAYLLPPTYIFEGARAALVNPVTQWHSILMSFGENAVYLVFALWFFNAMFAKSKETGQFAKLEG